MSDCNVSNKILIVALIIAIVIIIFLYMQKNSCKVEKMSHITDSDYEIEHPWSDDSEDDSGYRKVNYKQNRLLRHRNNKNYQKNKFSIQNATMFSEVENDPKPANDKYDLCPPCPPCHCDNRGRKKKYVKKNDF